MKRRVFIKQSCLSCAGIMVGGAFLSSIESCATIPVYKVTQIKLTIEVPKTKFINSNIVMVSLPWLSNDILLVKKTENDYTALFMKCSHEDELLSATNSGIYCSKHGSSFDLNGNVLKEPATKPLQKFKTEIKENFVNIILKS